jgi:hypothetical protein
MICTPELRFVERQLPYPEVRTVRILQQKWEAVPDFNYHSLQPNGFEWRDVPCVKEQV